MSGPESGGFGYPESGPAISEIVRAELLADLAHRREIEMNGAISQEITRDPGLEAMLALLIESSLEWQPDARAHLRRMITLRLRGLQEAAAQAGADAEFYSQVAGTVGAELDELSGIESLQGAPDLWDIAYEDLLRLEGGQDTD